MEERRNLRDSIAEAEQAPLNFMPKERAAYVRSMMGLIETLQSEGKTVEQIKERVPEFARDYENLFKAATSGEAFNKQNLKTMLALLDRMGEGQLSQHQASVIVGKKLADQYITPQVNSNTHG
jgi:hypothetical protein